MKRRLFSCVLAAALIFAMAVPAGAGDGGEGSARVLHELGLFNGVGSHPDGTPNFALDRTPTRQEAITMLVGLLGKSEEARNGVWETPFTDVAAWAEPYVGYAYANGLSSGTSATTYGGDQPVSASQYITFVLTALGYKSGVDFQWDRAWQFSDRIGLTDMTFGPNNDTYFKRGDIADISLSALAAIQKNSDQTLADKLIADGVFSAVEYAEALNPSVEPEISEAPQPEPPAPETAAPGTPPVISGGTQLEFPVTFAINGVRLPGDSMAYRGEAGSYIVTPYLHGEPFDSYEVEIDYGSGATVRKNGDGTFTIDFKAKESVSIALWYNFIEHVDIDENGEESVSYSRTKRSLTFTPPIPASGFVLDWNVENILPGGTFGSNYHDYFVLIVYYNGEQITDYTVEAESSAPFIPSIQADGSLLLTKTGTGRTKFTISYQGMSATFGVVIS